MLTGWKVPSSACKCVLFRPDHNAMGGPMELNFEVIEIPKWNIPTDIWSDIWTKSIWQKWCHFSIYIFTPTDVVIKMSKMAHFW